ncbi:Carboxymethylenebutenolidase [Stanieria cyanosphaera PCC 7437]|uniref:Carboxymethylenebutenolidase n=1 Tax=Stanieria cyanosphaera (strain ATCC 29371 / PCC 7437) TaxID=111780 RepID=K9XZJ8_STAC7|nr:dienelactone hydrolase family protein [Stanieria cyanosphaera]AFZ37469.1 Carboxymethylenebutenolidase [Stanieria cyanosphaera PCC 7437]
MINSRFFNWKFLITGLLSLVFLVGINLYNSSRDQALSLAAVHQNDSPIPTALAQAEPATPVITEQVQYATVNGQKITGYLARPQNAVDGLPGVIAIHEWWGLNDNIEAVTRRLAGEGYHVLAVDLYNGQVAQSPERAKELMTTVSQNPTLAQENLQQAYTYLTEKLQAPKVGSIGWCLGGSWSLQTALLFPEALDATVIYYGGQIGEATKEQLSTLTMPILGIFGAEDESIPLATVQKFEATLKELGKQADIQVYENAGHAFANPSGDRYVPEAAEKAWTETISFLAQNLQ